MSAFTRYEIVQSGVVDMVGGVFVRRIVLDSNHYPRPVYRTYRGKKLWETRTSQMAHRNDLIIESSWSSGDEPGYSSLALYTVSGPSEVAQGGKQLCRIPATEEQKTAVLKSLREDHLDLYHFLFPDSDFPLAVNELKSVLPYYNGWDGIGECERKQVAYIRHLLAPLPEGTLTDLCRLAAESPRIAVDPKERLPLPAMTDNGPHEIYLSEATNPAALPVWFIVSQSGFVTIYDGDEPISIPQGSHAAIKIWRGAFISPTGEEYGMIMKIHSR